MSDGEGGCKSPVLCGYRWRVTFAFYTVLLQTVNGKAGPFGTAPKAVHSSIFIHECGYFFTLLRAAQCTSSYGTTVSTPLCTLTLVK